MQLLGGEEETVIDKDDTNTKDDDDKEIDENTGFSTWNTISIKSITKEKEKEIQQRQLKQRLDDEEERRNISKQDEYYKKLEEAKYVSKDDSALGAYDVFNNNTKGYKGIDIFNDDVMHNGDISNNNHNEDGSNDNNKKKKKNTVLDYVPSLSSTYNKDTTTTKNISFSFKAKNKKKKSNIRKRRNDDD